MAGTKAGGVKAALTNKLRYGKNFYNRIGEAGGKAGDHTKAGFASSHELAVAAGRKGGLASKRPPKVKV